MSKFKGLLGATIATGAVMLATPSAAVITTFAAYNPIGTGANVYWKNNGTGAVASNGTGGSIYTISSANSKVPGASLVRFSFLQASIAPYITDVTADFVLNASVTSSPAQNLAGFLIQPGLAGTFSFLTTAPITIGGTTYATGANLLSGVFNQGAIFGQNGGTSGSFSASTTSGATVTYTSDFLSFAPTVDRDFALSLTSITSPLARASSARALRTFKAVSTGSFSTDPAPLVTAIPEPEVWGMMIVGFGMIGVQVRRRARQAPVAA